MSILGYLSYILFQILVPVLFLLSALTFIWGCFLVFIAGSADEGLAEHGTTLMLYGVVWFVLMGLSWWLLEALMSGL